MKFLIDESVEYRVVEFLRSLGHDVVAIAEEKPSMPDTHVLTYAHKTKRILLTNDKDFGTLVFLDHRLHSGVILLRLSPEDATSKINALQTLFSRYRDTLSKSFVVVTKEKIRIRKRVSLSS